MGTQMDSRYKYNVRLNGVDAFIDGGRQPIRIPEAVAEQSALLTELRRTDDQSQAPLPLPLTRKEINAWLKVTHTAVAASSDDLESGLESPGEALGNKILRKALKAATFLQDDKTAAAVTAALAKAILPARGMYATPTEADLKRAQKILQSVPQDGVPDILAAALRHESDATAKSRRGPPLHSCDDAYALFALLPTTFHPAAVRAYCNFAGNGDTLVVHDMPRCRGTACAARHWENLNWDIPDEHGAGVPPEDAPHCASGTFQFLAAAAPLAGGDRELAWALPGTCRIKVKSQRDQLGVPPTAAAGGIATAGTSAPPGRASKRRRVSHGASADAAPHMHVQDGVDLAASSRDASTACARLAAGAKLAALDLKLPSGEEQEKEPPRWCNALAQLRSLRRLTVAVRSADEFAIALKSLTCLETLRVDCRRIRSYGGRASLSNCHVTPLFRSICTLQHLSALAVKGKLHAERESFCMADFGMADFGLCDIFDFGGPPSPPAQAGHADQIVRDLSKLTRLTSLKFQCDFFGQGGLAVLGETLPQMPALREVHAELRPCSNYETHSWMRGVRGVVQAMCALPALQSFGVTGARLEAHSTFTLDEIHTRISARDPSLLSGLTGLHLPATRVGGAQCAALLAATPALQSLCLARNGLKDAGLRAVAGVLPTLPGLTSLDISSNRGTHTGLRAVLKAVVAAEGGGATLRNLNICSTAIKRGARIVQQVASLVAQLTGLEFCGLADLGQEWDSAAAVDCPLHNALKALPELRFAYKGCDVDVADVFAIATIYPSLDAAFRRMQRSFKTGRSDGCGSYEPPLVSMTWPR